MIKIVSGWEMFPTDSSNGLWEEFEQQCTFNPSAKTGDKVFFPKVEYDIYDCSKAVLKAESCSDWTTRIRNIFIKVKGKAKHIYAFDWQHSEYKYTPEIDKGKVNKPYFVADAHGGFNVYLPKFYPDGDYYLFLAKDFSWGYLADPWRMQIIIYGDELRNEISRNCEFLELYPVPVACQKSSEVKNKSLSSKIFQRKSIEFKNS